MIVVLTALDLEYTAMRAHLLDLRSRQLGNGTLFESGVLAGHPDRHVALASVGTGNSAAATVTDRAIAEFRPGVVLFVGIAGGLNPRLATGDIVVATRIYAYHGARVDRNGYHARPRAFESAYRVEQVARHLGRTGAWHPGPTTPKLHFGPVVAGEVLLDSQDAELRARIRTHYNDALAIEMESAGFAHAGHLHNATATLTVRGISDHADGTKSSADADDQVLAATNAAAFATALITHLDDALETAMPPKEPGQRQSTGQEQVTQTMTGSPGGIQVGNNLYGGVVANQPPPPNPDAVLNRVTTEVVRAHNDGTLDRTALATAMLGIDRVRTLQSRGGDPRGLDHELSALREVLRGVPAALAELTDLRGVDSW